MQVNPRADAAVQCSLGPRTLPASRPLTPVARARGRLALYSPLLNPRLFTLPEAAAHQEEEAAAAAGSTAAGSRAALQAAWWRLGGPGPRVCIAAIPIFWVVLCSIFIVREGVH